MWPLAHFFTSVCLGLLIFKVWIRVSTFHLESCAVCLVTQSCPTLASPEIVARQAPLSMGFSPGKSTGVACHFLLHGSFLTQGSNPGLLHCSQTLLTKLRGKPPLRVLLRNKGNNPGQLGPTSSTREAYNPHWFLTLLLCLLLHLE